MSAKPAPDIDLGSRRSEYTFFIRTLAEGRMRNAWPRLLLLLAFVIGVGWLAADCWPVLLLLCAGSMFAMWRFWPIQAALYDRGITYRDRMGIRQVSWDQIEQVWRAVPHDNGLGKYVLHTQDGEKVELSFTLFNYSELGRAIEEGVHQVLQPKCLAMIESGQRATFGPVALDNTGIYFNQKHLTWGEVSSVETQPPRALIFTWEGTPPVVHINKKKQTLLAWASVKEEKIPNVYTFYELVSRFHRGQVS